MNLRFARVRMFMAAVLGISMMVTFVLLAAQGRWKEAVHLHLCSMSAILAVYLAVRPRAWTLDTLFYLGIPGAALALVFASPAVSSCQVLMNLSYTVTHTMILVIPVVMMIKGMRPRPGKTGNMMLILLALAMAAHTGNTLLETDFFFLVSPPAYTPLVRVFSWGYPAYMIVLFGMMLLMCMAMDMLAQRMEKGNGR